MPKDELNYADGEFIDRINASSAMYARYAESRNASFKVAAEALRATQAATQTDALSTQVGGAHYKSHGIQPVEYIHANGLGFCEGNVVKYVTRWRDKGGKADLLKARHYIDLLIELEKL